MMPESPYLFGHSQSELRRLAKQGTFYALATEDMMRRAGITPGMRALDVGSGAGDVALLAARLVGASGVVVGWSAQQKPPPWRKFGPPLTA